MSMANLTARDNEILCIALQHCVQNPEGLKVDYEKLAQHAGFKTAKSAGTCWLNVKKKLFSPSDSNGIANDGVTKRTNATAQKGRRGRPKKITDDGVAQFAKAPAETDIFEDLKSLIKEESAEDTLSMKKEDNEQDADDEDNADEDEGKGQNGDVKEANGLDEATKA